jgi:hypothetical protein
MLNENISQSHWIYHPWKTLFFLCTLVATAGDNNDDDDDDDDERWKERETSGTHYLVMCHLHSS